MIFVVLRDLRLLKWVVPSRLVDDIIELCPPVEPDLLNMRVALP